MLAPWKKNYNKPRQHIKKQRHYFANKGPSSQSYGFSSSHVWMWELDHKEGRALKNWWFWIVVQEKNFESPLDSKEVKTVNLKEINTDYSLKGLVLKLQYFGHLMWSVNSLEKTLMLGKIEGRRRRATEGEMMGWHHGLNDMSWANSGRQWSIGELGMLQSMGSQRVGHYLVTEPQQHAHLNISEAWD